MEIYSHKKKRKEKKKKKKKERDEDDPLHRIIYKSCKISWIEDKKGEKLWRICGFFLKILHVRRRNTCLCKGEMCFILLGGVLTSFFLYTSLVTIYRYTLYLSLSLCWCMFFFHLPFHVLFLFSLYTHASYYLYAIYLFLFHTKMP